LNAASNRKGILSPRNTPILNGGFLPPTYLLNGSLKQPLLVLQCAPLQLAGVQLDDQLFVDHRLNFFTRGNAGDFAFESIAINRQPVGNRDDLS
jgi:hypothetical protein